MEKIAVHCKHSMEIANKVIEKASNGSYPYWFDCFPSEDTCVALMPGGGYEGKGFHTGSQHSWEYEGYRIIEASEYLGGGESVEQEFKVGDEVEIVNNEDNASSKSVGDTFIIRRRYELDSGSIYYRWANKSLGVGAKSLKLVNSKPLKEEVTMGDTTIKDVILNHYEKGADAKVVQGHFGSQIADDINGEYLLKVNGADILKRAKKAEKDYLEVANS